MSLRFLLTAKILGMHRKTFLIIVSLTVLVKFLLLAYTTLYLPEGKFQNDTEGYLDLSSNLMTKDIFARTSDAGYTVEMFRTPGYPFFLGILHYGLHIPLNGIIAIQVLMTFGTAWLTYKTAIMIDQRLGLFSAAVILLDFQILVSSLLLISETLFMLLISFFMFNFVTHLKTKTLRPLIAAALFLAAAVYVRPIGYYLGIIPAALLVFCLPEENYRITVSRAMIFLILVFGCLGIWQWRNYKKIEKAEFSSINLATLDTFGLIHSYSHYQDSRTKGLSPVPYYMNVTVRSFFSLMTTPGTLKYFKNDFLKKAGVIFAYPWVILWFIGLLIGIIRMPHNMYFYFLALITGYFICASFIGIGMWVEPRFRVPFMPFAAILSAYGWQEILRFLKARMTKIK